MVGPAVQHSVTEADDGEETFLQRFCQALGSRPSVGIELSDADQDGPDRPHRRQHQRQAEAEDQPRRERRHDAVPAALATEWRSERLLRRWRPQGLRRAKSRGDRGPGEHQGSDDQHLEASPGLGRKDEGIQQRFSVLRRSLRLGCSHGDDLLRRRSLLAMIDTPGQDWFSCDPRC